MPSKYRIENLEFVKNPLVKYDPNNPADSCLAVYTSVWLMAFLVTTGILLLLIACLGIFLRVFAE